jgi:hypothetical protein
VGLVDVADEHDLLIWRALGACLLGAAKTGLGRSEEGLAEIRDGLALYQGLRSPPVFWPLILFGRAGACARSGRPSEGLSFIEEAIEIAGTGSALTLLPELYSLKGDLLLLTPEANARDAEASFQRAFAGGLLERSPRSNGKPATRGFSVAGLPRGANREKRGDAMLRLRARRSGRARPVAA